MQNKCSLNFRKIVVVQSLGFNIAICLQPNIELMDFRLNYFSFPLGLHEPK